MERPGLMVAVEGLDASGKRTQATRLVERLEADGHAAQYIEFPTYDRTRIGQLIEEYLDGEYDVPPEVRALLYSADRYQLADRLEAFIAEGGVLVADRYSPSNYAFQGVAMGDADAVDWMEAVDARLPRPDIVILLDIPPETARELMVADEKEQDVHEDDLAFQRQVAERYRDLADERDWTVVDVTADGELRSKQEIADEIWDVVEPLL